MIAFVTGQVAALAPTTAVVEVGGVGMAVQCTPNTLARLTIGQQAVLHTSLVVREDSLTLYGFADDDERQVFELLQTASGVGPRLAQAMLAVHSPDALRAAVASGDEKALTAVPGIGKKGAQKLLLELKDRLGTPSAPPQPQGPRRSPPRRPPGATSCTPPWSASATRPARRSSRLPRWPRRPRRRPAHRRSAAPRKAALQTLNRAR